MAFHLQSLILVTAVLVNIVTALPEPHDLHNTQDQHGQHSEGQEKQGQQSEGQEKHGQNSEVQEKHGHHSEVETLQPQLKPIPTKQAGSNSGAHHHVHSTSSSETPSRDQFQFSQFLPPTQFGQSQPAQQFGQFPQFSSPFGFQQPSPQLLNCQCFPALQQFSPFQSGFQNPSQPFNAFTTGYQQPSQQFNALPTGFQQPSQQFNALPTGFQQQQSASNARPHCHITCHEH